MACKSLVVRLVMAKRSCKEKQVFCLKTYTLYKLQRPKKFLLKSAGAAAAATGGERRTGGAGGRTGVVGAQRRGQLPCKRR